MDSKTIKALIEVASKSENQEALDGVLEVQQIVADNADKDARLAALQAKYDEDVTKLKERNITLTGDLAHFAAKVGIATQEPEKPKDRNAIYQEYNMRRM